MTERFYTTYDSPLGPLLLECDDEGLTGLYFKDGRYCPSVTSPEKTCSLLLDTKRWLDIYFSGGNPDFTPPLHIIGSDFYSAVSRAMLAIPYGELITYGEIAAILSKEKSARAVGGAVGHNKITIIVPCHRVIGAGYRLVGYGGGMWRKIRLLELEGTDLSLYK